MICKRKLHNRFQILMFVPQYPSLSEEDQEQESYDLADTMDPELYKATVEGDILEFAVAMENWAMDRHDSLPDSCVQLGPQQNTVLHIAACFGHHEIVKLICKDIPFLAAEKDARGDTALHIAARSGDKTLVSLLLDSDFKEGGLGEVNNEGNTALHEALRYHHEDIARILIEKNLNMTYSDNKEGESLLYLAAEAGYPAIIRLLMDNPVGNYIAHGRHRNKSPVHAAINRKNIEVLELLWKRDCSSFKIRCDRGRNPLHNAAYRGYTEGVNFILSKSYEFAYSRDRDGFFPIHLASGQGHSGIVQLMLKFRPDSRELLSSEHQNILHIAAKSGKCRAFYCMLKMPELESLINARDQDGNTPLHVATTSGRPKTVSALMWDERVSLELQNNDGQTALDIAEEHMKLDMVSFHKRLTWMALRAAGAPRAATVQISRGTNSMLGRQPTTENCRDKVNVTLLVASFVATVTFAAGLSLPGGYRNSDPGQGIANMLAEDKFQEFVIFDSLALYSSVIVAVTLIWAQLGDQNSMHIALKFALPLLGISLGMMFLAFMAGVYLVVSKLSWLAKVVLFLGSIFVTVLFLLFLPLCFLGSSKYSVCRHLYYPVCFLLYALGSYTENEAEAY